MRFVLVVGFLYSLMFADAVNMAKILDRFYKNIPSGTHLRSVIDLSPYEASKYIGGYAVVNYYYGDTYYIDNLYFTFYDVSSKMIMGMRMTKNGQSNEMACGKGPTGEYQLMCVSKLSDDSETMIGII